MLKFFKGKDKGNLIYAPCKGRVVPLAEVPDPVFADKVLGDGFAVIPADGRIYAPADGEVAMVCISSLMWCVSVLMIWTN